MQLTEKQRQLYAEKVLDLGHIAAGALIFGQYVSGKAFSWSLAGLGILIVIIAYVISYFFTRRR